MKVARELDSKMRDGRQAPSLRDFAKQSSRSWQGPSSSTGVKIWSLAEQSSCGLIALAELVANLKDPSARDLLSKIAELFHQVQSKPAQIPLRVLTIRITKRGGLVQRSS